MPSSQDPPPVVLPITGELDLHTFDPRDLPKLIPVWLSECRSRGFREVRLIHGKGTGQLRASVRALLRREPQVCSFSNGDESTGSWGATIATLHP
jgi:dsDNA-specific endonuclease/ATPase MutS2